MRLVLLSLRSVNDRTILNFDLTGKLTDFNNHHADTLEIKLETGTIKLNKWAYLNKYKIYEDNLNPKCFFLVGNYKSINHDHAFKTLMQYAIDKIDLTAGKIVSEVDNLTGRLSNLHSIKAKLQKAIAA